MFGQIGHISSVLTSTTIPAQLIVQPTHAWTLLLLLLALSCAGLWFLTRPREADPTEPVQSPTSPGPGHVERRQRPTVPPGRLPVSRASADA